MSPSVPEADVRGFVQRRIRISSWREGFVPRRSGRDLRGYATHRVRPSTYHRPRAMSVIGRREHISI
ncbi:hypothetical protein L226DRAFT_540928 [Lentinus tigrinus ALCF2SS1-7]|uniref:uncharacterized protein n=1 Tax=Lentinus tigrinus ALCF2SS1-7 TaxID=1328758 RepID=UPI001166098E|nr:hypothetical protein L226DRAFT_540928 [Lentinus tigrinus ALCF2SS1-7]